MLQMPRRVLFKETANYPYAPKRLRSTSGQHTEQHGAAPSHAVCSPQLRIPPQACYKQATP